MDSWDSQTPSPNLKFENSPAESFLSTPGDMYPSLFSPSSMNPLEITTPQSFAEGRRPELSVLTGLSDAVAETDSLPATPSEKKSKKRKSWGQVLPEPKTNLPPRKRAKTEDEKEQRRVERVLRNRRAAQSSRERKRLEVEALEQRNKELEAMLRQVQQTNLALVEELHKFQRTSGVVSRSSPTFDALRPGPVTFSQELFSSQDGHNSSLEQSNRSLEDLLMSSQSHNTVNPASLSPALSPITDEDDVASPAPSAAHGVLSTENASPDATQHPAAMLCQDLQCRSAEAPRSWLELSQQPLHPAVSLFLPLQLLLASTSAMLLICQRPLMQIAMSLRAGFSLPPTPAILNTIIWLVTNCQPLPSRRRTTKTSTSSTLMNSSMTNSMSYPPTGSSNSSIPTTAQSPTRLSPTLRLKYLRKILSRSPTLARPLTDATMAVLRLVSSEGHQTNRVSGSGDRTTAAANGLASQQLQHGGVVSWPNGAALPSKEVLLTLLWAIRVEERRIQIIDLISAGSAQKKPRRLGVPSKIPTRINNQTFVLKVVPKRAREVEHHYGLADFKRRRSSQ